MLAIRANTVIRSALGGGFSQGQRKLRVEGRFKPVGKAWAEACVLLQGFKLVNYALSNLIKQL